MAAKAPPKGDSLPVTCIMPSSSKLATEELSPPLSGLPQVTTEPLDLMAAKASKLATEELSPPLFGLPQVTTDPKQNHRQSLELRHPAASWPLKSCHHQCLAFPKSPLTH
eukprot:TRINITY_DN8192_c0_g1_i1.p1 TRINITY_DN8192_c0_g1~~TRINITY_DN8192_c0_g1_i1.p1  ORF type:complete len:110 (+),score=15.21 TRINITY_DN8192_c0_g1_i1:263-592(+)